MRKISVSKFKATCLALLESVKKTGEPILITKHNVPLAQVLPPPPSVESNSGYGCMAGKTRILGDIIEPIGTEDWEALH